MVISDEHAQELASRISEQRLVPFVGAGASLQAVKKDARAPNMPLWLDLANSIAQQFGEDLGKYSGVVFDLFDAIAQKHSRAKLENALRNSIPQGAYELGEFHRLFGEIPWPRVYTTNYDDLLKRALREDFPILEERDFDSLTLPSDKQPRLIHLHGDLSKPHTLTGKDYEVWAEKHPRAQHAILNDGAVSSFLFIGYSNSDPHLKHAIQIINSILRGAEGQKNFAWLWRPTREQVELFLSRDKLVVHPIETDLEWTSSIAKVYSAYAQLKKSRVNVSANIKSGNKKSNFSPAEKTYINGYKLFYHRDFKSISRMTLAKRSGLAVDRIRTLEKVRRDQPVPPPLCFRECSFDEIRRLNSALKVEGTLECGQADDLLAHYIEYYKNNWKKPRRKSTPQQDSIFKGSKAVVFDFGGTLTIPKFRESTWERVWVSAGYDLNVAGELHHAFSTGKITHEEWCNLTCDRLRDKGFNKHQFEAIYQEVEAVPGIEETFAELRRRGIQIHIASGSLRQIIEHVLGKSIRYVDSIRSNNFLFDEAGLLVKIVGHPYDFEGKAKFISYVAEDLGCHPIEILFVGNSLNDEKAATSGARTLCVNPKHTHPHVVSMWNNTIRHMTDLRQILVYV